MQKLCIGIGVMILGVGFLLMPTNTFAQGTTAGNEECLPEEDIMLNTYIPFIGRCIKRTTEGGGTNLVSVFPKTVGGLTRILMTAVVIFGFLGILVGGFMIASDGAFGTKQAGVKLIVSIIAGLILLGASGIILNLINPTFFGTAS